MTNTVFGPDPYKIQENFITPSNFESDARVYSFIMPADSSVLLKPPVGYPFLSVYSASLLYFRFLDSDTSGDPVGTPTAPDGPAEITTGDKVTPLGSYRMLYSNTFLPENILRTKKSDGTLITETEQKWMFISTRLATEVALEFKERGVF